MAIAWRARGDNDAAICLHERGPAEALQNLIGNSGENDTDITTGHDPSGSSAGTDG